jgi:hypothetical protein
MRTFDIVLRLHNHQQEIEPEVGKPDRYIAFNDHLHKQIANRAGDIVYKGDYFRYDQHLLPKDADSFSAYVLFRNITLESPDDGDHIWQILLNESQTRNFTETREKNNHHVLIELSSFSEIAGGNATDGITDTEEILIRIPGTREELEFDAAGPEGNKILYDKLAKLIYDKEAEVMYKGPRLIFEDNTDLFISPDDFSVYVLFRSGRSSDYESREQLWANLEADLKVLSSITLLRSAEDYQVILITHNSEAV